MTGRRIARELLDIIKQLGKKDRPPTAIGMGAGPPAEFALELKNAKNSSLFSPAPPSVVRGRGLFTIDLFWFWRLGRMSPIHLPDACTPCDLTFILIVEQEYVSCASFSRTYARNVGPSQPTSNMTAALGPTRSRAAVAVAVSAPSQSTMTTETIADFATRSRMEQAVCSSG